MILLLLRHGDAAAAAATDADRPLTPRGRDEARRAGLLLKKLGVRPDVLLASPLVRAQETARIASAEISAPPVVATEHLVPSSDHRQIMAELSALNAERVLCVGHEPHIGEFVALLTTGSRAARIFVEKGSLDRKSVV